MIFTLYTDYKLNVTFLEMQNFVLQGDFRVGRLSEHVMCASGAEGRAGEGLVYLPDQELELMFDQQNTSKPRILTLVWQPPGAE